MIARPHHLINAGDETGQSAPIPPAVAGLDLSLSADNVAGFGGDPHRYARAVQAGLTAGPDVATSREAMLSVAAVAAWRAGVLGIRADALIRLAELPADVAGAVLGLHADAVTAFLAGQRFDRFYWPLPLDRLNRPIARLGGFVGLGGIWEFPPTEPATMEGPGRWTLHIGAVRWRIDVDLFAHVLGPVGPAAPPMPEERVTAHLVWYPTSYLVDVVAI